MVIGNHFMTIFGKDFVLAKLATSSIVVKTCKYFLFPWEKQVPSLVDGKRRYLAIVSDFVSRDSASLVPRLKINHSCKIPPLSIHE